MKVELIVNSAAVSMEETEAIALLSKTDLSQPVFISTAETSPRRVYISPGSRPSKPLPLQILDDFTYKYMLSGEDIFRMLHHGRTSLHKIDGTDCRFSVTTDRFGRADFHTHLFNLSPSIPDYHLSPSDTETLLLTRHLGHTVNNCYVSYDSLLNDFVLLPTQYIFIPTSLRGIKLSFRQRHVLASGRPIRLGTQITAQVDALTASITFR